MFTSCEHQFEMWTSIRAISTVKVDFTWSQTQSLALVLHSVRLLFIYLLMLSSHLYYYLALACFPYIFHSSIVFVNIGWLFTTTCQLVFSPHKCMICEVSDSIQVWYWRKITWWVIKKITRKPGLLTASLICLRQWHSLLT